MGMSRMQLNRLVVLSSIVFVGCVVAYVATLSWLFERAIDSYLRELLLSVVLAALMIGRGVFYRLLAAAISIGGSISSFKLAFHPFPNEIDGRGLIYPGVGFAVCACLILVLELARFKSPPARDTQTSDL